MTKEIWKVFKDTRSNNPKNTRGALWEISDQGNIKKNSVLYDCKLDIHGYKVFGDIKFLAQDGVSIELLP